MRRREDRKGGSDERRRENVGRGLREKHTSKVSLIILTLVDEESENDQQKQIRRLCGGAAPAWTNQPL